MSDSGGPSGPASKTNRTTTGAGMPDWEGKARDWTYPPGPSAVLTRRRTRYPSRPATATRPALTTRWDRMPPKGRRPPGSWPYAASAASGTSRSPTVRGEAPSASDAVRLMTSPWRHRPVSAGQSQVPSVVITTSSWARYEELVQPVGTGRVMPLSWSTTRDEGGGPAGAALIVVSVPSRASPVRSTVAPPAIAGASTAAADISATALARPGAPAAGVGGAGRPDAVRRYSVQVLPSHQRSRCGA